jgi:hypothetical protein
MERRALSVRPLADGPSDTSRARPPAPQSAPEVSSPWPLPPQLATVTTPAGSGGRWEAFPASRPADVADTPKSLPRKSAEELAIWGCLRMFAAVGKGGLKRRLQDRPSRPIDLAVAAVMAHSRAVELPADPRRASLVG